MRQVNGKSVLNVNVAYDVGFGDKRETQWMRLALWGDRADKVASHMTKGKQLVVKVDDLKVRMYDGNDGRQASLEGTLIGFDFVSDGSRDSGQQSSQRSAPAQDAHNAAKSNGYQQQRPASPAPGNADFDDDLPF